MYIYDKIYVLNNVTQLNNRIYATKTKFFRNDFSI